MKLEGRLFGIVPYDFRFPTPGRLKERMWNPGDPRIIVPRVFGAGWAFNLATLRERSAIGFYAVLALYAVAALKIIRTIAGPRDAGDQ
jgi:hypothetical protein